MESDFCYFTCPHCGGEIQVMRQEINCQIFRHAVFKDSMTQINPHASQEECKVLIENQNIYGCGKPFRLVFEHESWAITTCGFDT